jgi:hypothetical protein
MPDKIKTIAKFENYLDASIAKIRLEDEGIKSVIVGEDAANLYGMTPVGSIELQVFDQDADKAIEILNAKPEQQQEQND